MKTQTLLEKALNEFDRVNRRDPRRQRVGGKPYAREFIFAQTVYAWIERLDASASEAVRLAARSHTLRRWEVPRNRYRMDAGGYRQWRAATAAHSADAASEILRRIGYPETTIREVHRIITGLRLPKDPDTQLVEDADALAFLEIKLEDYITQWDEAKIGRILEGTWSKMSPRARAMAADLPLDPRVRTLLVKRSEPVW
ncbi:MAG TPA: DUF4202 domain-containing protein [Nitrospiria bacterium]|nr:DUF4202 domain-containing protein [Nitrospiria bacterium]